MDQPYEPAIADLVEQTARVAHEVNRAYCHEIGDDSQVSWEECPDWQRASARDGVIFHINNPNVTLAESHANWMRHKYADGWAYGAVKDPAMKRHPCMVPYGQLPPEQRMKDGLFKAVVAALCEKVIK